MARAFLKRQVAGEVLVAWGQMHTLLEQEKGRSLEVHLAERIVDHPDEFQDVTKAMYAAGCDIGAAGTQGNNRYRLREFGLEDRLYELTLRQIQLARAVTPENCYLAGRIGLTGRFLEPVGDMTVDELYQSDVEQIIPMLEGRVDLFVVCENDMEQVAIGIRAVRDHCDLPVMALTLFYPAKRGFRTLMGVDIKTASARFQEAGADVIGCFAYPDIGHLEDAVTVIKEMRQGCDKPLTMILTGGTSQEIDGKIVYPITPEEMAKEVPDWIAAGASIVGGAGGASLKHIKAISEAAKGKKW